MANFTIPVFDDLVRDFNEAFSHRIATATRGSGILSEIDVHAIHEGASATFVSSEGEQRQINLNTSEAMTSIRNEEIEQITLEDVMRTIKDLAEQFRKGQTRMLIELMNKTTSEAGNIVDGQGRLLSNELILEAIDKMKHEFDEAGNPRFSFVVHPDLLPRLAEMEQEYRSNPELRKKHEELLARKRDEFRSREMDRNLAG